MIRRTFHVAGAHRHLDPQLPGRRQAKPPSLIGPPSEICRVFPEGSAAGDPKAAENIADVDALNEQLVGVGGFITSLPDSDPMAVLSNYFSIGALWVTDPTQPASPTNQRGSLQLANPVMETTFQGTLSVTPSGLEASTQGVLNCFGCHNYTPGQTRTTGLSHTVDDIHADTAQQ